MTPKRLAQVFTTAQTMLFLAAVTSLIWVIYASYSFLSNNPLGPLLFPGDPPFFEFLLFYAGIPAFLGLTGLLVAWLYRRTCRPSRLSRSLTIATASAVSLSVAAVLAAAAGIARRHFGDWAPLKQQLSLHAKQFAEYTTHPDRPMTDSDYTRAKSEVFSEPVYYQFHSTGQTVEIRPMQTTYPYVGVDFGEGANAVFDLRTMFCIYSD